MSISSIGCINLFQNKGDIPYQDKGDYKVDNQACVEIKAQDSPLVCNALQYLVSQIFDS